MQFRKAVSIVMELAEQNMLALQNVDDPLLYKQQQQQLEAYELLDSFFRYHLDELIRKHGYRDYPSGNKIDF